MKLSNVPSKALAAAPAIKEAVERSGNVAATVPVKVRVCSTPSTNILYLSAFAAPAPSNFTITGLGDGEHTYYVRIVGSANFHFVLGASPTASAASPLLPSGEVEIIKVSPGEKIAVFHGSSTDVYVTEMGA